MKLFGHGLLFGRIICNVTQFIIVEREKKIMTLAWLEAVSSGDPLVKERWGLTWNDERRQPKRFCCYSANSLLFSKKKQTNKIFIDFWLGRIHGCWPGIVPNFVLWNFWKKSVVIIRDVFDHVNRLSFEPFSSEKNKSIASNHQPPHRNDRWIVFSSKSRQKHWIIDRK